MALQVRTINVPGGRGGLIGGNKQFLQPSDLLACNNTMAINGLWAKRPGTSIYYDWGVAATINSLYSFGAYDGTQYLLTSRSDGVVQRLVGTPPVSGTLVSGLSGAQMSFTDMNNKVYMTNGFNDAQIFTPPSTDTVLNSNIPTDWATNKPFQFLRHNNRMWAINNNTVTLYYSRLLNAEDWVGSGSGTLQIAAGGANVALAEFQNRLFVFKGDGTIWLVNDFDNNVTNWSVTQHVGRPWNNPPPASYRAIAQTITDLLYMDKAGHVYSFAAMEAYGDYKRADLTYDPLVFNFFFESIASLLDMTDPTLYHLVYDKKLQYIYVFGKRKVDSTPKVALAYSPALARWFWLGADAGETGIGAYSSTIDSKEIVYTGGTGKVWQFTPATKTDGTNAIVASFKTPMMDMDIADAQKEFRNIRVIGSTGITNLSYTVFVDTNVAKQGSVVLNAGTGDVFPFVLGTSVLGGPAIAEAVISVGKWGRRIGIEITNSNLSEDLGIDGFICSFKPTGQLAGAIET